MLYKRTLNKFKKTHFTYAYFMLNFLSSGANIGLYIGVIGFLQFYIDTVLHAYIYVAETYIYVYKYFSATKNGSCYRMEKKNIIICCVAL